MKPCALAVIFNHDKTEVLLTKRRDVPLWVLPGGGIETEETPEVAVLREVFEETGLTVNIERKSGEYYPINRLTSQTYLFECRVVKGLMRLSNETSNINFFPLAHLPRPLFELHKLWLNDCFKEPKKTVRKPIAEVTYTNVFFYFLKHPLIVIRLFLARFGLPINS